MNGKQSEKQHRMPHAGSRRVAAANCPVDECSEKYTMKDPLVVWLLAQFENQKCYVVKSCQSAN
jgi:hypothetical protein